VINEELAGMRRYPGGVLEYMVIYSDSCTR
jgi:hypothetical protein